MKKISIFSIMLCAALTLSLSLKAQKSSGHRFYSEFGGPGVIMSANFDSRFKTNERLGLGYRLGVGFGIGRFEEKEEVTSSSETTITSSNKFRTYYTVPLGINYVFGRKNSAITFEVGATATVLTRKVNLYNYEVVKPGYVVGGLQFMFCRIPVDGGFTFRAGFTPMIGTAGDLFPMAAVGLGYAF